MPRESHAPCQGTTAKGRACRSKAMPFSPYCGPHHEQALRKARAAFDDLDHPHASTYSQLLTDMLDKRFDVVEVDFDWLRAEWRRLKGE